MRLGAGPPGYRSGFASIVGRPNVGKSTLLNQMLRSKVSITSSRPQTTRAAVRGVLTTPSAQIVFVDTPGLHKPRTVLGERLNTVVRSSVGGVDVIVFVLDASDGVGRGDRFVADELANSGARVLTVLNKTDLLDERAVDRQRERAAALGSDWPVVPLSARTGSGVPELVDAIIGRLPEGPLYYPPDMQTDQPERTHVAELIREKLLERTRDEVPHSVAVVVDEIEARGEGDLVDVEATIYVERDSQKGIVIGHRGEVLRQVGTAARPEIEAVLGHRVFLRLRVKVEPDWQKRAALVERFGYGV